MPPGGCTAQSEASWRLPLAIQIVPAVVLGAGMLFFPDTPRWLLMRGRPGEARQALARLRRCQLDSPSLVREFLEIKAAVVLEEGFAKERFPGLVGVRLDVAQVDTTTFFLLRCVGMAG